MLVLGRPYVHQGRRGNSAANEKMEREEDSMEKSYGKQTEQTIRAESAGAGL